MLTDQNKARKKEGDVWICLLHDKKKNKQCGEQFESLRGLRVHQCRSHRALHYERCRIVANQCCYCGEVYEEIGIWDMDAVPDRQWHQFVYDVMVKTRRILKAKRKFKKEAARREERRQQKTPA